MRLRVLMLIAMCAPGFCQTRQLNPEDLFVAKNVSALALSPDGRRLAFVVREASLKENKYKNILWISAAAPGASARKIADDGSSPQWSPDGRKLAYIAPRGGRPQIVIHDVDSASPDMESASAAGVNAFRWSPSGLSLVFLARDSAGAKPADNGRHGAVIDKLTFSLYKLMGNELFVDMATPVHMYLFNASTKAIEPLLTTLHVDNAEWAPDGKSLAIVGKDSSELGFPASIYLYSLESRKAKPLLQGESRDRIPVLEYSQPTWSPDGSEMAVVSKTSEDRWANSGTVGIYSLKNSKFKTITGENQFELYAARFFWPDRLGLTVEDTVRARTQLFQISGDGTVKALTNFEGDTSSFSLSGSGDEIAFVHNDVQHAPEIYVAERPFANSKQVTALNAAATALPSPLSERVHWTGAGGVAVEGLLLKPANYTPGKKYPLLVMVHGGPGVAIKDSFEPYSLFSQWAWPYPFRVFTDRGYLVFFPNYRGTGSYGKVFRLFKDMNGEPAEDIVSGVEYLIHRGDADPSLVGILGHSHGGWLGPYVLTHHKSMFKAASFAEGALDAFSQYGMLPGWLNLYTHEFYNPGTPYENTQRYIEMSPIFAMKGLETPTLLEFGQKSLALLGLETLTALWREGVPHEMVVYPGEGHNLAAPDFQLESARRNLDWFEYWMFGRRDPDPAKQEQYRRWEAMARKH